MEELGKLHELYSFLPGLCQSPGLFPTNRALVLPETHEVTLPPKSSIKDLTPALQVSKAGPHKDFHGAAVLIRTRHGDLLRWN